MHGMNIKVKCAIFETLKKFLLKFRIWDVALFRLVTDAPKNVVLSSNSRNAWAENRCRYLPVDTA